MSMIYSEDAPTLEKKLHKVFANNRVNMINNRKEVVNNHAKIEFTQIAEAKDFRETL